MHAYTHSLGNVGSVVFVAIAYGRVPGCELILHCPFSFGRSVCLPPKRQAQQAEHRLANQKGGLSYQSTIQPSSQPTGHHWPIRSRHAWQCVEMKNRYALLECVHRALSACSAGLLACPAKATGVVLCVASFSDVSCLTAVAPVAICRCCVSVVSSAFAGFAVVEAVAVCILSTSVAVMHEDGDLPLKPRGLQHVCSSAVSSAEGDFCLHASSVNFPFLA
ncbi:unnamed protein product, partial [Protopolystoma xenopodis]